MTSAKERGYYTPLDVKRFVQERDASPMAWTMFITLIVAMLLVIVIFVAPGWAWALEVHTYVTFEGSMYGHYGLWFSCWTLSDNYWDDIQTDCELMLDLERIPFWWKICQGISMLLLLIGTATLAVSGSYCYIKNFAKSVKIIVTIIIMCVIEAVLTVALFTVWCVLFINSAYWCCPSGAMQMLEWRLHYCFIIACILPAFFFAVVIMGAKEIHVLRSPLRLEQYQRKVASTRQPGDISYTSYQPGSQDMLIQYPGLRPQAAPDMMAYHPGVRQSYVEAAYTPASFAQNQYAPINHMPPQEKQPEQDLLQQRASQRRSLPPQPPLEKPLGPDEVDLSLELAY